MVRAHAVLAENQSLVPNIRMRWPSVDINSSPIAQDTLIWPVCAASHTQVIYTYTKPIHMHIK